MHVKIYIEIKFAQFLNFIGYEKDSTVIPEGPYCYEIDYEKNKKEPILDGGFWIKTCKYYRYMEGELKAGCTYVGVMGDDLLLGDQCKICDKNKNY